jgi:hypothetical protein
VQRPSLLLGLLVAGVAAAGAAQDDLKRVAGRAVLVSSICGGGAAVRDEDLARLPPPQPIAGKEFLVVAGEQVNASPPRARFVTRADGTFVTRLPPGKWCFFEAARKPSEPRDQPAPVKVSSAHVDPGCLEQERRRCDLVLSVKANVARAEITFTARCPQVWNQPCYRGPMPP